MDGKCVGWEGCLGVLFSHSLHMYRINHWIFLQGFSLFSKCVATRCSSGMALFLIYRP